MVGSNIKMVLTFLIQTLGPEEPELVYYRFYSTWTQLNHCSSERRHSSCLFDSNPEKKELLTTIAKKFQMHYSLKLKQSVLPIQHQDSKTIIKGYYMESDWKSERLCVIWQGVPGIGFSLVCEKEVNIVHAQSVLDLIVAELEKYLQLVSYPTIHSKTISSVALIVDHLLPGGQLLFLNSSLIKSIEKKLEIILQS